MLSLKIIVLVLALVAFVLAAFEVQAPRVNLVGLGLAFLTLSMLVG